MWYWWVVIVGETTRKVFSPQGFSTEDTARLNLEARTMQSVPDIPSFARGDYIADYGLDFRVEGYPR